MEYLELVDVYQEVESTTKRLEKTFIISEFLKKINEEELQTTILLLQGRVFPQWDERKIGVASRLVLKAINKATGIDADKIEKEWAKIGDLGNVAENLIQQKKQVALFSKSLTIKKVFDNISKLATLEGLGTVNKKVGFIAELLTSAKPLEAKYIIRTLLEELRVGMGGGTLRDSIYIAFLTLSSEYDYEKNLLISSPKEEVDIIGGKDKTLELIQLAYDMSNDFSLVAKMTKKDGIKGIKSIGLKVGIPIKVMLGPKEKDAKSALERVDVPAQAEYKYDGFRIQVHKDKDKILLFTRNLENVTKQFPEIVKYIKEHVKGDSFILDSEAVGFSSKTGEYLPFQSISQRIRRKYDIEHIAKKFPVELNIFDCMYYNGKNMIKEPFKNRRALLEKIVKPVSKKIVLAKCIIVNNEDDVNKFYKQSLKEGNEGLMLKKLDAPYKPGARVGNMVKMKEAEEPMDLVITGAERGEGKRAKWFSSFRLACLDENGNFVDIGKVGTGIKEKTEGVTFDQLTKLLEPLVISQKGKVVKLKPKIVVEIAYEEIQKSPNYSSGYALRFPRVLRLRNMERSAEDIVTLEEVEDFYFKQKKGKLR